MSAEPMREALTNLIDDVQKWCDAVEADSSWDGWDHHYKALAYDNLAAYRRALLVESPDPAAEALRAAAPDLYEALAMLVEMERQRQVGTPTTAGSVKGCWERARKALKKARAGVPDRKQAGSD